VIPAARARALPLVGLLALLLSAHPAEAKKPLDPTEKIDVNAAPLEELMRLPGIGRKRAEAIVALRAKRPLRRPEELASVKGISPAWVARNRASLTTGGAATPAPAQPAPPTRP
jgi:competence protein ComEA